MLLAVGLPHLIEAYHCLFSLLEVKQGSCKYGTNCFVFRLIQLKVKLNGTAGRVVMEL